MHSLAVGSKKLQILLALALAPALALALGFQTNFFLPDPPGPDPPGPDPPGPDPPPQIHWRWGAKNFKSCSRSVDRDPGTGPPRDRTPRDRTPPPKKNYKLCRVQWIWPWRIWPRVRPQWIRPQRIRPGGSGPGIRPQWIRPQWIWPWWIRPRTGSGPGGSGPGWTLREQDYIFASNFFNNGPILTNFISFESSRSPLFNGGMQ